MRRRTAARREDNVRIGPISVITLIAIICMSVMAVLAASTAYATNVISERQADATSALYLDESAAQELLAGVDDTLAGVREGGGEGTAGFLAVKAALDDICEDARAAADGKVDVVAYADDGVVNAEFTCANSRKLIISVSIRDDATFRIDKWKMLAVQEEAPSGDHLWSGE